ncbi:hypothetical protein BKI52_11025 [marine bacterium AO1-C]|nr:hypothetical protein BKI52_11025 [marine bacterium AO1-C]
MDHTERDSREVFENYSFQVVEKLFEEGKGDLNKLTLDEQEVVRIWRLEADMYNGGFIQFFCNWGYDNFKATQQVLKKIKAEKSLSIITECEQMIAKAKDDPQVKEYWDIPKVLANYLTPAETKRLDELDELYWDNPDDIQQLAYMQYLSSSKA